MYVFDLVSSGGMTMDQFADATQQIYLGLPSFYAERRAQWERRMQKRRKAVEPDRSAGS